MFENIERIQAPSREVFIRDYVLKQKPVIITNLFEGQPIREMDSLDKVRQQLGDTQVLVNDGYDNEDQKVLQAIMSGRYDDTSWLAKEPSTIREFLEYIEQNPTTRRVISEVPASLMPQLHTQYEPPVYCRTETGELDEDYEVDFWMGRGGHFIQVHFDRDARNMLQYQVFGEKRVILIPPESSKKLVPIRNSATVTPVGVSETERDEYVRYMNGYQAVVRTGEALFMPLFIYHSFDYTQTSMAFTMRFFRNQYHRFMAQRLHTDFRIQLLGWKLVRGEASEAKYLTAFRELEALCSTPFPGAHEKSDAIQKRLEDIYEQVLSAEQPGYFSRQFVDMLREGVRRMEVTQAGFYQTA